MAEPIKNLENTTRHWTKTELDARKKAEGLVCRENIKLHRPSYIKDDKSACKFWRETVQKIKDVNLLDYADEDTLATYCCKLARVVKMRSESTPDIDTQKQILAEETALLQYATKLGLTPESRARLARKRAAAEVDPDTDLYGN